MIPRRSRCGGAARRATRYAAPLRHKYTAQAWAQAFRLAREVRARAAAYRPARQPHARLPYANDDVARRCTRRSASAAPSQPPGATPTTRSYVTATSQATGAHGERAELLANGGRRPRARAGTAAPSRSTRTRLPQLDGGAALHAGVGGGAAVAARRRGADADLTGDAPPDVVGTEVSDVRRRPRGGERRERVLPPTSSRARGRTGRTARAASARRTTAAPAHGELWALAESGVFARVGRGAWEATLQAAQSDEWLESVDENLRT